MSKKLAPQACMLGGDIGGKEVGHARETLCSGILDTCTVMKLGKRFNGLREMGFMPYVISRVLWERKNLSRKHMRARFLLNGATVIDDNKLDIKQEALRLSQTYKLDSPYKKHSHDDPDWLVIATAKLKNQPIISEDRHLRQVAQQEGIHAIPLSVLMRQLKTRVEKLKKQIQQNRDDWKKCLICGKEVRDLHKHLVEAHPPDHQMGKSKRTKKHKKCENDVKSKNLQKNLTKDHAKQTRTQESRWTVISHTTITNVSFKGSQNFDNRHCGKQVAASKFSKKNHRSDEMVLVKMERKKEGETVRIYCPRWNVQRC